MIGLVITIVILYFLGMTTNWFSYSIFNDLSHSKKLSIKQRILVSLLWPVLSVIEIIGMIKNKEFLL